MGSLKPTEGIDIPINGLFVMGLTVVLDRAAVFLLFRSRWGLRVRATTQNRVMAGAVGINTAQVDRLTFALGCGLAGIAGAAFTTIGSTGPDQRLALHRRHLPGGGLRRRAEPARHHRLGVQHRAGAVDHASSS